MISPVYCGVGVGAVDGICGGVGGTTVTRGATCWVIEFSAATRTGELANTAAPAGAAGSAAGAGAGAGVTAGAVAAGAVCGARAGSGATGGSTAAAGGPATWFRGA